MTAVTINLPDQLARYATEQDKTRPGWLETLVRRAKRTAKPDAAPVSANAAAWKEFLAALDRIDDEPLGEMPPRCAVRRELPQ